MKKVILLPLLILLINGCNIYDVVSPANDSDNITIYGDITDELGNALSDIRILAIPVDINKDEFLGSLFSSDLPYVTSSDNTGFFEMSLPEEGEYAFAAGHILQDNYVPIMEYDLDKMEPVLPLYDIEDNTDITLQVQKGIVLRDSCGNVWHNGIILQKPDSLHKYKFVWNKIETSGELKGYAFIIWNASGPLWSIPSSLDTLNPEEALSTLLQDTTFVFPPDNCTTLEKGEYRVLIGAIIYENDKFEFIPSEPLGGLFEIE